MSSPVRLHIGCGTVYLTDWINVDLPSPNCFLASERPDLVERYRATADDYYARHKKTIADLRKGPLDQSYVCDRYGSYNFLPVVPGTVDEMLARHSFEHLSITEARSALVNLNTVMKLGGELVLDVPDHEETLRLYRETGDEFYVRHLLGPRRNDYGYHCMSFTPERLTTLVQEYGFEFKQSEPNIHIYPAICLRFVKLGNSK